MDVGRGPRLIKRGNCTINMFNEFKDFNSLNDNIRSISQNVIETISKQKYVNTTGEV